jgi:protein-tyrosine phosphatase
MVCEGNVRRSPMAAALWRERFRDQPMLVQSAGLHALAGVGIDPEAETMLVDHGLTGKPHVARQVTSGLVDAADLVLVMDCAQALAVQALSRYGIGHTFMLGKWSGVEIPDPSQRTRTAFASVYRLIRQAVDDWHRRLNGHAGATMNS